MNKYLRDVKDTHQKFGFPMRIGLRAIAPLEAEYRLNFLKEERNELAQAVTAVDFIDALVDLAYVAWGTVHYLGIGGGFVPAALPTPESIHSKHLVGATHRLFDAHINAIKTDMNLKDAIVAFEACCNIARLAQHIALTLGFSWDLHWKEVHRANTAKERCSEKNPSSRGITVGCDLVKPEGWVPPDHATIINDLVHRIQIAHV